MEDISDIVSTAPIASRDVLDTMTTLRNRREPFAVATVIETQGSVSAKAGSKAIIGGDGHIAAGWVGGGCAESTVCHAALGTLKTGESTIVDLDLNDEVLGTGMPCGGTMRVFVEPFCPSVYPYSARSSCCGTRQAADRGAKRWRNWSGNHDTD